MGIALIDHSTLSSVERVLGRIPIRNRSIIDGDLSGFEHYINAILFYNQIFAIDDYKEKYRLQRINFFQDITFINPNEFNNEEIVRNSQEESQAIIPTIEGGKFTDENFRNFFDLLKININCTWDISSSIYYLTLKMLGSKDSYKFQKYSEICHLIFSQLSDMRETDENINNKKKLIDRNGRIIEDGYQIPNAKWGNGEIGGLTQGLGAFISSLNWIAYKSIYYTKLAEYFKADTFLHPIRQNFQLYYMNKTNKLSNEYTSRLLRKLNDDVTKEFELITSSFANISLSIKTPIFLGSIISKVKYPALIIEYTYELREKKEFVQARLCLEEISNLITNEESSEKMARKINKISNQVEAEFTNIRKLYGTQTKQGDITSTTINSFNAITKPVPIPSIPEGTFKKSAFFNIIKDKFPKKSFSMIYRNLSKDLLNISKLGQYYDLLTRDLVINNKLITHNPKVEDPQYQDSHSWWKSPM